MGFDSLLIWIYRRGSLKFCRPEGMRDNTAKFNAARLMATELLIIAGGDWSMSRGRLREEMNYVD